MPRACRTTPRLDPARAVRTAPGLHRDALHERRAALPQRRLATHYRLRLPCEVLTYELTGLADVGTPERAAATAGGRGGSLLHAGRAADVPAERAATRQMATCRWCRSSPITSCPTGRPPQKRLVEHTRTLFFKESLDGPVPLGPLNRLALPYETLQAGADRAAARRGLRGQAGRRVCGRPWPTRRSAAT